MISDVLMISCISYGEGVLAIHIQKENIMVLLLPFFKVLIGITLLFGLWVLCGGSVLFAFLSVLITGFMLLRQYNEFDL